MSTRKLRVGVAVAALCPALAAGAPVAAAADGPVAKAAASKAASKRYIRAYVRQYLDSRIDQLRGPQGPQGAAGPAGRNTSSPSGSSTAAPTAVSTPLDFRVRQNTASVPLYTFNGLEFRADCSNMGEMTLMFRTSVQNAMLYFFGADPDTDKLPSLDGGDPTASPPVLPSLAAGGLPVLEFDPNFDVGEIIPIGSSTGTDLTQNIGNVQYTTPEGRHVSMLYQAADRDAGPTAPLGGTSDCVFAGTAITS